MPQPELARLGARLLAGLRHASTDLVGVLRVRELGEARTLEALGCVAQHLGDRRAGVSDHPVGVDNGDDILRVLDERAEVLLATAQRLLRPFQVQLDDGLVDGLGESRREPGVFDHVTGGAHVERAHRGLLVAVPGHHDYSRVVVPRGDLLQEGQAFPVRQHVVEGDDVEMLGRHQAAGFLQVARYPRVCGKPVDQYPFQLERHVGVVFDDQCAYAGFIQFVGSVGRCS